MAMDSTLGTSRRFWEEVVTSKEVPRCSPPARGQFTSKAFTGLLEQEGVQVSTDWKVRDSDNIFVERLWRTIKYEEVYLKAYTYGRQAGKVRFERLLLILQHPKATSGLGLSDTGRGVQWRLGSIR